MAPCIVIYLSILSVFLSKKTKHYHPEALDIPKPTRLNFLVLLKLRLSDM